MAAKISEASPIVFVVDDDDAIREALRSLFRSVGLQVETFNSAAEFLQSELPAAPGCLVLDVRLPGLSGLDFQAALAKAGIHIPIIFLTGHADVPMSVKAIKAGAVEFLTKPFREQDMLDAIRIALEKDGGRREEDKRRSGLRNRFDSLTAREKEVIGFVTAGLMNKQIAHELSITEVTVKMHRSSAMRKLGTKTAAGLTRIAQVLDMPE